MVYGTKGIVSCSQPLAAEAGLEILRKGGNAGAYRVQVRLTNLTNFLYPSADAAVATSAALNVTEPSCCGIGGFVVWRENIRDRATDMMRVHRDAFCLFYDAKSKQVKAMNGSGRAPKKLDIDYLRKRGIEGRRIPLTDLNSVTVPGSLPEAFIVES